MIKEFTHSALDLQQKKPIIFTALSKKLFYMRMFIVSYVLKQGYIPINPFMSFDYFLLDSVDRDVIRNANNNLVSLADELWVFGPISNGVMAEIKQTKAKSKKIKYFKIQNDSEIIEISPADAIFEDNMELYKNDILSE